MSTTLNHPLRTDLAPVHFFYRLALMRWTGRRFSGPRRARLSGHLSLGRVAFEMRLEHWCKAPQLFVRKSQAWLDQRRPA